MMREYKDKQNVQAKSYYNDRYWVAPRVPTFEPSSDAQFNSDLESLKEKFTVNEAYIQLMHLVIYINPEDNKQVLEYLYKELGYGRLMELSAMDWLAKSGEFEVFYEMLNIDTAKRIRVKCFIKETQAIESVQDIFRLANFAEREMYDMLGVKVNNHPFMKRILMPDDWHGHPLRKTYPLQGDEAASWYEVDKIFGKEARDIIGPEIRDGAAIDRYDTERFARLGYEVKFGEEYSSEKTEQNYQEDEGVFLVKKLHKDDTKTITDRDR